MRYFICLLSFLFFVGCEENSSNKNSAKKSESVLNIAVSADYPPYIYSQKGKLVGFEVEVINAVAKSLDKTIHFHDIDFHGILKTVSAKQVDGAISAIAATPERREMVDFSNPYHRSMTVLVVPFATSIRSIDDLHDKVVGVESGTIYEDDLKKKNFKDIKFFARKKFPELQEALKDHKCDAIVTGYPEAYEMQNGNPDLKIIPIEGTVITFSIALPKNSPLLKPINDKLQSMIESGDLRKLESQYFKKIVED